jgi:hypothetical protein
LFHPRPDRFDGVEVAAYGRHEQRNSFVLLDVTGDFVTAMRRVVVHHKDFICQSNLPIKMLEKLQYTLSICGFRSCEIYAISQVRDCSNDRHVRSSLVRH